MNKRSPISGLLGGGFAARAAVGGFFKHPQRVGALILLGFVLLCFVGIFFLTGCAHNTTVSPGRSEATSTTKDTHAPETVTTHTVIRITTPCHTPTPSEP